MFAHSDELAVAAIRTIRRAGLDVPGDLSVTGIDDHPIAALTDSRRSDSPRMRRARPPR